jgi:hypothetical protein
MLDRGERRYVILKKGLTTLTEVAQTARSARRSAVTAVSSEAATAMAERTSCSNMHHQPACLSDQWAF